MDESLQRKRPDLRHSNHLPSGQTGYRIEFEVDSALPSDFDLWHFVLNYYYLPMSEADADEFDNAHSSLQCSWSSPTTGAVDEKIRASWERIFDLDWYDQYVTHRMHEKQIQATLWSVRLEDVIAVDRFTAR